MTEFMPTDVEINEICMFMPLQVYNKWKILTLKPSY